MTTEKCTYNGLFPSSIFSFAFFFFFFRESAMASYLTVDWIYLFSCIFVAHVLFPCLTMILGFPFYTLSII